MVWPASQGNLDDHFQFVVYGTSNKLNAYMCSKKVPLVKKWVNYMPRKGFKLEIVNFRILFFLFWFNSHISLTTAPTNVKLGRDMKFCDPMNNVKFKTMSFLGKQQQPTSSTTL